MSYTTLYDLMDHYREDELDLPDARVTDADRISRLVHDRLRPAAVGGHAAPRRRRGCRALIAAAAAVMAAVLGVTAYAVYQASLKDYIIQPSPAIETGTEPAPEPDAEAAEADAQPVQAKARLSLVGYQGTPEYEAYAEWSAWHDENWDLDRFSELGVDDSYYEVPENYALLYDAHFRDQAEKLDEIMEKYGLTPLEELHVIYAPEEVYDYLGTAPFLPDGSRGGGYVYDDGTFELEAIDFGTDSLSGTLYASVKGSFSMVTGFVPQDYEEWSYTTASGQTLDLVMGTDGSLMLLETDGAYIHLDVDMGTEPVYPDQPKTKDEFRARYEEIIASEDATEQDKAWAAQIIEDIDKAYQDYLDTNFGGVDLDEPIRPAYTKQDLEALADTVGFDVLAQRFAGPVDREKALENYHAFVQRLESATDTHNRTGDADAAIAAIGDYAVTAPPEGYALYRVHGQTADDPMGDGCNYVTRRYQGLTGGEITLTWSDGLEMSEVMPLSFSIDENGETVDIVYPEEEQVTVSGHDARYLYGYEGKYQELEWIDPDLGLRFQVRRSWGAEMTRDEFIAMAESVAAQ